MNDLIRRKDAINLLESWSGGFDYIEIKTESAIKEFQNIPSAQPEIVRCKDCQYFDASACASTLEPNWRGMKDIRCLFGCHIYSQSEAKVVDEHMRISGKGV